MTLLRLFLFCGIFGVSGTSALAVTLTESIDTVTYRDSTSTAVWNSVLGYIHPPLQAVSYSTTASAQTNLNVGDGSHGSFDSSTYANFGTVAGSVITIDTNQWPELKVTQFVLASGSTLRGSGPNPLIIRSLSDVLIYGTIDCRGGAGSDSLSAGTPTGGSGRCGGSDGGEGGSISSPGNGLPGASSAAYITSGSAGGGSTAANGGTGGGGGGGFEQGGSNPTSGITGAGANAGNSGTSAPVATGLAFSDSRGGSGGGGGGGCDDCGGNNATGAGGGAGGGVIQVYAARDILVGAGGAVRADGGAGGAGTAASVNLGGGGGGGSGGTVVLLASRNFVNDGAASNVSALGGAGGNKGRGGASNGGTGAWGRIWITDSDGTLGGSGTEDPQTMFNNTYHGKVFFQTGTSIALSQGYDLSTTRPSFISLAVSSTLPGLSALTMEVSGSRDNSTWSSFVGSSQISQVNGYRYFRFRATLANTGVLIPAKLDSVTVTYNPDTVGQFEFNPACGTLGGGQGLFWLLSFWILARARRRSRARIPSLS